MEEDIGKAKSLIKRVEAAVVRTIVVLARARRMEEVGFLAEESMKFQTSSGVFVDSLRTIDRLATDYLGRIPPKEAKVSAKPVLEASEKPKRKRKPAKAVSAKTVKKATVKKKAGAKVSAKFIAPKVKKTAGKKPKVVKKPVVKKVGVKKPKTWVVKRKVAVDKKKQKLLADIKTVLDRGYTGTGVVQGILRNEFGYKNVSGRTINGVRQRGVPKKKK